MVEADISDKEAATLTLSKDGLICDCNSRGGKLLGSSPGEIIGQHINRLLPELADFQLVQEKRINSHLRYLSGNGYRFLVVRTNRTWFTGEVIFVDGENIEQHPLRVVIMPLESAQPDML